MKQTKLILSSLLMLFLVTVMSVPAFAASNKAARLNLSFDAVNENSTPEERDKNSYTLRAHLSKKTNLSKTSAYSAKLIIPKSLLQANGDLISVSANLVYNNESQNEGLTMVGTIPTRYDFFIIKQGKKIGLMQADCMKDKPVKKIKYASGKTSGSNYILTLKNVPFQPICFEGQGPESQEKEINTKKKYVLTAMFTFTGIFSKAVSGSIDLDEFSIKTNTEQKITFNNKKGYFDLKLGRHGNPEEWTPKFVAVKP